MTQKEIEKARYLKIIEIAKFLIETKSSNSVIAEKFDISKKTLSDYLNKYLKQYAESSGDYLLRDLYETVKRIQDEKQCVNSVDCEEVANYIIDNKVTVEIAANHFGVSVSTIQNATNKKLIIKNIELYEILKMVQKDIVAVGNIVGGKNGVRTRINSEFEALEIAENIITNSYTIKEAAALYKMPTSTLYELILSIDDKEIQEELDYLFEYNCELCGHQRKNKI